MHQNWVNNNFFTLSYLSTNESPTPFVSPFDSFDTNTEQITDFFTLSYISTSETSTHSYTLSLKNEPPSGGATPIIIGSAPGFVIYVFLLKTESLDNAILELWLG